MLFLRNTDVNNCNQDWSVFLAGASTHTATDKNFVMQCSCKGFATFPRDNSALHRKTWPRDRNSNSQSSRAHLKFAQPWHHGRISTAEQFCVGISRTHKRQKIAMPQNKLQVSAQVSKPCELQGPESKRSNSHNGAGSSCT